MRRAKRILVTGGAGFISSNVIRHLLTHTPHEVVSLDALTYAGSIENLDDVMGHERLAFVHGDIRDAALVRDVVAEVDVIVNAAAESHVEKSIEEGASEFVTTNVEGTQILLDAIRETPVERFLLLSSSEVYGTAEYVPMDEEHPLNARSPYAATKAGGDRLAYAYFVTYDLPIVIVRPFNNYGPRQHPEKVIPRFITQALEGEPLTVHGDGHASRDWLWVDDHAEALEALIEAPLERVAGEVVNIATGIDISVSEIAELVVEAVGQPGGDGRDCDGAAGAGRPASRLDGEDGAPHGLARADELRGRARANGRLVPRERGLVAGVAPARRPRLLVLGAGPAQLGLLAAARRRGLHVIAADRDPQAIGFEHADERAVISTDDEPALERLARAREIDGVISPGSDWAVGVAARIAERLGVVHPIDAATAGLATSKARQRERFAGAGVPQPRVVPAGDRPSLPCVVKPADQQGQRGLSIVREQGELAAAVAAAVEVSRGGGYLVEELVEGPEITVNAVSVDGAFVPLAVTDRLTAEPPAYGVALAHVWPSASDTAAAVAAAGAAAEALGVRNGPTYTQIRLGADGPRVMELAARLGGGHDAELVEAATGVPLNDFALDFALGLPAKAGRLPSNRLLLGEVGKGACVVFLVAPVGELRSVEGIDAAEAVEGVRWVRGYRRPGWRFGPLLRGGDRAGAVLAVGTSRADAVERAHRAAQTVRFEVDEDSA